MNNIQFERLNIKQAFDVKSQLEKMEINIERNTVILLDIKDMYPCIKIGMIEKEVKYVSRGLPKYQKMIIETAIKLMKFRRRSMILIFDRKYYELGRMEDKDDKGMEIGSLDSAFVSDLVAAYILLELVRMYINDTRCIKIYRDNGIVVWNRIISGEEVSD